MVGVSRTILYYSSLILTVLIFSTQVNAESHESKKDHLPTDKIQFVETDIDISADAEEITDLSDAEEYINRVAQDKLGFNDKESFVALRESSLKTGHKFYHFRHHYRGIPVALSRFILSADEENRVNRITGHAKSIQDLNIEPALSGEVAIPKALKSKYPNVPPDSIQGLKNYELVIWVKDIGYGNLAYKSELYFPDSDNILIGLRIYADANTGAMLAYRPLKYDGLWRNIYVQLSCGDYELPPIATRNEISQPSRILPIDTLYSNLGDIYKYLYDFHGLDSYDDFGHPLNAIIKEDQCVGENAFWNGRYLGFSPTLVYSLDIIGHELMHAIIDHTSDLDYKNESGALNESLSDILGMASEFWLGNEGFHTEPSASDYLLANERYAKEAFGGILRDMSDPTNPYNSQRSQPDFYPDRYIGDKDHGGVHINSGIINLAFYLLVQGGQHPKLKTSITVPGIGIEKAVKLYFEANKTLFDEHTNFRLARKLLSRTAITLYGDNSEEFRALNLSFDAVGIPRDSVDSTTQSSPQPPQAPQSLPRGPQTPEAPEPEQIPPQPQIQTSDNTGLLLIAAGLLLLLLFFMLSYRKRRVGSQRKQAIVDNFPQPNQKHWVLLDTKTGNSISLNNLQLLSSDGFIVGRSSSACHQAFPNRYISTRHARFFVKDNNLFIEDLDTTNGTYVDGIKLKPFQAVSVGVGRQIKLANYTLLVN